MPNKLTDVTDNKVGKMTDRDYEAQIKEFKRALQESQEDNAKLEMLNQHYELQLAENEKKFSFLEGQIKAYEFCIARRQNNAQ
jgi:predicted RecB family nuclease